MRTHRLIVLIALLSFSDASLLSAGALDRADMLFENGFFPEAESAYLDVLHRTPGDRKVTTLLGMIELFSNHLDESEKYLRKSAQPGPFEVAAKNLLGELFYRRDNFPEAARWFRAAGGDERAVPLELFGDAAPYAINGPADETRLPFVVTDPLPIVSVRVNGGEAAHFLIDTGGAEVQLDSEFAKRFNIGSAGGTATTLLDGSQTEMRHARLASLTLGEFEVNNVPVGIRRLPVFAGRQIDGVLGTVLLYHFLATLDYPNGELILRRASTEALHAFEARANLERQNVMPIWMASDHVILARGRVNHAPPALLFVATGVAVGFTCPNPRLTRPGFRSTARARCLPLQPASHCWRHLS